MLRIPSLRWLRFWLNLTGLRGQSVHFLRAKLFSFQFPLPTALTVNFPLVAPGRPSWILSIRASLSVEQPIAKISVRLPPLPHVFRHPALDCPFRVVTILTMRGWRHEERRVVTGPVAARASAL